MELQIDKNVQGNLGLFPRWAIRLCKIAHLYVVVLSQAQVQMQLFESKYHCYTFERFEAYVGFRS